MELWLSNQHWLHAALNGMASPWAIAAALVLTSYLLEDVAIASGAALATQGMVSWEWAFVWVAGGIASGDLGLYVLGLGARRLPWLRRKYVEPQRHHAIKQKLEHNLAPAILLARIVPGLRLVTYTLCGFARVPVLAFCLWVALAVSLWTAGLFWLGAFAGAALAQALHIPAPVAVALPIVAVALAVPLVKYLRERTKAASA